MTLPTQQTRQYLTGSMNKIIATLLSLITLAITFVLISTVTSDRFSIYAVLVIVLLIIIIIVSQVSRRKHKRGRLDLQFTQKELEQKIVERTEKLTDEIAKQQATEVLLTETQEYLNSIINSMPSVLIGVTDTGTITHWNSAAEHSTGIQALQALNHNLFDIYPDIPVTSEMITTTIAQGIPRLTENIQQGTGLHAQHSDLTIYPLLAAHKPGAVIRLDDVTMRVRMENMMIQNEKMLSLGELAAGMAHEINNPLSAIINSIQNIQRRTTPELPKNHEVAESLGIGVEQIHSYLQQREVFKFLDSIREAGDRSAKIVTSMLEFSRNGSRNHEPVDLQQLLEHALLLASNSFQLKTRDGGTQIQLQKEYEDDLPIVPCAPTEIQQVILNLLRNACQCFITSDSDTEQAPQITLRLYRWDDNICLEVEDNGPGMNEEVSRHIFEPFYTTKEVGQGTGLGLSVSYFIVTEHHDGRIEVESKPGEGTNFIITLPLQAY
jgi:PAS domain S-box-containing protein